MIYFIVNKFTLKKYRFGSHFTKVKLGIINIACLNEYIFAIYFEGVK